VTTTVEGVHGQTDVFVEELIGFFPFLEEPTTTFSAFGTSQDGHPTDDLTVPLEWRDVSDGPVANRSLNLFKSKDPTETQQPDLGRTYS
jgi:hypothetical protein